MDEHLAFNGFRPLFPVMPYSYLTLGAAERKWCVVTVYYSAATTILPGPHLNNQNIVGILDNIFSLHLVKFSYFSSCVVPLLDGSNSERAIEFTAPRDDTKHRNVTNITTFNRRNILQGSFSARRGPLGNRRGCID